MFGNSPGSCGHGFYFETSPILCNRHFSTTCKNLLVISRKKLLTKSPFLVYYKSYLKQKILTWSFLSLSGFIFASICLKQKIKTPCLEVTMTVNWRFWMKVNNFWRKKVGKATISWRNAEKFRWPRPRRIAAPFCSNARFAQRRSFGRPPLLPWRKGVGVTRR